LVQPSALVVGQAILPAAAFLGGFSGWNKLSQVGESRLKSRLRPELAAPLGNYAALGGTACPSKTPLNQPTALSLLA
jgi:hypothetical protein